MTSRSEYHRSGLALCTNLYYDPVVSASLKPLKSFAQSHLSLKKFTSSSRDLLICLITPFSLSTGLPPSRLFVFALHECRRVQRLGGLISMGQDTPYTKPKRSTQVSGSGIAAESARCHLAISSYCHRPVGPPPPEQGEHCCAF